MILTTHGFIEFRPARELVRADVHPEYAWFKDGRSYLVNRVAIVGKNQIRIEGTRDTDWASEFYGSLAHVQRSVRRGRDPRAAMNVAANEIIPVILGEEEDDE